MISVTGHSDFRRYDIMIIRRMTESDACAVADMIGRTLIISDSKDYSKDFISQNIASHSVQVLISDLKDDHMYIAVSDDKVIGCGGITGYWGSKTESYLKTFFVDPDYQKNGIGEKLITAVESDEFFLRAWRTEVGSSITARGFYLKMGYAFKNGVDTVDECGTIRMEKIK